MGLKSGSRDSGLDDDQTDESDGAQPETRDTEESRPSAESIPYTYRRDAVNEDRSQIPFFLRESVLDSEQQYLRSLEDMLDEDVYKSDAREAGQIVAHRHPELVADVLREWGYDLD